MTDFSFQDLTDSYPQFIERRAINDYFSWLTPSRMKNLDSLGKGPKRIKMGKTVIYPTRDLLEWLDNNVKKTHYPGDIEPQAKDQAKVKRGPGRPRKMSHTKKV